MGTVVGFTLACSKNFGIDPESPQMHPPMQDMVTLTAMLCRFNAKKAQFEFEKSQVEKLQVEKLGMQLELARKHRERGQGAGMEPARV